MLKPNHRNALVWLPFPLDIGLGHTGWGIFLVRVTTLPVSPSRLTFYFLLRLKWT